MHDVSYRLRHSYDIREIGIEIPIVLHSGDEEVRVNAKIDTGAEFCVFQRIFCDRLGLVLENGLRREIWTAAGTSFIVFGHDVRMACLDLNLDLTVYFAEAAGFNRNVLGRTGWLQQVRLGLIDCDSTLFLSHYND